MRVAIHGGAGGVGSSLAFSLLVRGGGHEISILDTRAHMVTSHVMDLEQVLEQGMAGSVRGGAETDVREADVIACCASVPEGLTHSRMVYLESNAQLIRRLGDALGQGYDGVVVMVTNPVDPLVTLLQRETGIDRCRVIGYCLNDSLRLRTGIARQLGVEPGLVDAWMLGEHGDSAVPLFDRVRVCGTARELTADQRDGALSFVRGWFATHKALDSGRSSTWTSGLGVARLVEALGGGDADALFPASVVLEGEYGIHGVSLGVPVTLGRGGVHEIHEWALSEDERAALGTAADVVRQAVDQVSAGGAAASV